MKKLIAPPPSAQRGVVLIEAMVAILLFSVGVLAVAGLQAVMIQNTSESKLRAEAGYLTEQMIGRIWADPVGAMPQNAVYNTTTYPADLPGGVMKVTQDPGTTQLNIAVGWTSPGEDPTIGAGSLPCELPQNVAHCFVTNTNIAFN